MDGGLPDLDNSLQEHFTHWVTSGVIKAAYDGKNGFGIAFTVELHKAFETGAGSVI